MPDPFAFLPTEISLQTLCLLDPLSLGRISTVSKLWNELTNFPKPWRKFCLYHYSENYDLPWTSPAGIVVASEELETLQDEYYRERTRVEKNRLAIPFRYTRLSFRPWTKTKLPLKSGLRKQFKSCCKNPKAFFVELLSITRHIVPPSPPSFKNTPSSFRNLLRSGLVASTTDFDQNILQTLLNTDTFWSSTGTDTDNSRQWLCYKMIGDLCVVRGVEVIPYEEMTFIGELSFPPRRIRFSVGFTDNPAQMHYHSRWFDVQCNNKAQYFDLSPELVVGGYLFITTEGKPVAHPIDDRYYIAFHHVKAQGVCIDLDYSEPDVHLDWGSFGEMRRTLQEWRELVMKELGHEIEIVNEQFSYLLLENERHISV